jgi:hypothetical protein
VTRQRLRDLILIVVGCVTPVGILAVNAAAFVMQHLNEFRTGLAIAALLSTLLLNGLAAGAAIRFAHGNAPLLYAEYKRVAWIVATIVVAGTAAAAAYYTYVGLGDPRRLPNGASILASVWALGTPFVITYFDRRFLRRREVAAQRQEEKEGEKEDQTEVSHRRGPQSGRPRRPAQR